MRFHGTLFFVAALSAVVGLLIFADDAWAPAECGDGYVDPAAGEECEVGVPCADPADTCDEAACLCSPPPPSSYCSPGFWKNHPDCWCEDYDPSDRVDSVFTVPSELSELADDSLMKAAKYGGGGGVIGAARNLLRHAVSALLNACSDDVDYPMGVTGVINTVNAALATLDRDEITRG